MLRPLGATRRTRVLHPTTTLLVSALVVLAACGSPSVDPAGQTRTQAREEAAAPSNSGAPRTLRVASLGEIITVYGGTSSGARELGDIFNAGLTLA